MLLLLIDKMNVTDYLVIICQDTQSKQLVQYKVKVTEIYKRM